LRQDGKTLQIEEGEKLINRFRESESIFKAVDVSKCRGIDIAKQEIGVCSLFQTLRGFKVNSNRLSL